MVDAPWLSLDAGQVTSVHDHVSWYVVGVYRSAEEEPVLRRHPLTVSRSCRLGTSRSERGSAVFLVPPRDIRCVRDATDHAAISQHVYGTNRGRARYR